MQTINDIKSWELLQIGEQIDFPSDKPRAVRLEFNVAGKALIYMLLKGEKQPRFLALVEGRETVRVVVPGAYALLTKTKDAEVFLLTDDNQKLHRNPVDEETFTTFHEPRAIDENYERILNAVNRNMNIRLHEQAIAIRREVENEFNSRASVAPADSVAPKRDDGQQPPDTQADEVHQPDDTNE